MSLRREWIIWGIVLVALATYGMKLNSIQSTAYAINYNGEQVAVVQDKNVAENAVAKVLQSKSSGTGMKIALAGKATVAEVRNSQLIISPAQLEQRLNRQLVFTSKGYIIKINNQKQVALADEQTARDILRRLKNHYSKPQPNVKIEAVAFAEKVSIIPEQVPLEQLTTPAEAFTLLAYGQKGLERHVVREGESLWTIARANDLRVKDIEAVNPGLKSESLQIGQILNIVRNKPLVTVVSTMVQSAEVPLPYQTKEIKDRQIARGKSKVRNTGHNGLKKVTTRIVRQNGLVTAQKVLISQVLRQPVDKVVAVGAGSRQVARFRVASRSEAGGGDGSLSWPLRGSITSGYGYRGREFHTGIDIDGVTGDPVRASASGTVVTTGWEGGYGRTIVVDHGDGLSTLYAHLSEIYVGVGERIDSGQSIGAVGSTGRSTGSHLHFEVLNNGSPRNPRGYLP